MILEPEFDLEPLLKKMASSVEPSAEKRRAASASHNNLTELLTEGAFGRRIVGNFLSGSYSRGTAIHPIDDVDIVYLIDPNAWAEGDIMFSSLPNPSDVLRSFAIALRRRYVRTSVYTQRRSVRLALNHLDIDVVPAIPQERGLIKIPDLREGDWIVSGPTLHRDLGAAINTRTGGAFKPTVKLLKSWNSSLPSTASLKSFTVESMAMALFAQHRVDGLFDSLVSFFDFTASLAGERTISRWGSDYGITFGMFGPTVPDPSGASSNVAGGLSKEKARKFLGHAVRTRDLLVQAAESQRATASARLVTKALKFEIST